MIEKLFLMCCILLSLDVQQLFDVKLHFHIIFLIYKENLINTYYKMIFEICSLIPYTENVATQCGKNGPTKILQLFTYLNY